jgi:hypothetical protein
MLILSVLVDNIFNGNYKFRIQRFFLLRQVLPGGNDVALSLAVGCGTFADTVLAGETEGAISVLSALGDTSSSGEISLPCSNAGSSVVSRAIIFSAGTPSGGSSGFMMIVVVQYH